MASSPCGAGMDATARGSRAARRHPLASRPAVPARVRGATLSHLSGIIMLGLEDEEGGQKFGHSDMMWTFLGLPPEEGLMN